MLLQLEIKNFAIIEHSLINFEKGFNVITGETGTGKSILLEALSSVLGERTRKDLVRKGTDKAKLKAVFAKNEKLEVELRKQGLSIEEDYIIIERQINKNGRTIFKINGRIETLNTIRKIQNFLVEICSQKDHLSLLKESYFLKLIDTLGDDNHQKELNDYRNLYEDFHLKTQELNDLLFNERKQEQLLDLYRFQKKEIENAELRDKEEENLVKEREVLSGFEKMSNYISSCLNDLDNIDKIFDSYNSLNQASTIDVGLTELVERIQKSYYELEDVRSEVQRYINSIEYDEERLNQIMFRLETINNLKRKYGDSLEEILSYYNEINENLIDFENKEEKVSVLEKEINSLKISLKVLSQKLHKNRLYLSNKYEKLITKKIQELCMPEAKFKFNLEEVEEFLSNGVTKLTVLFNANKGEDLKSLSKIASGGELSRVLLALKLSLNNQVEKQTLIFDEVDEGIGGEVGRVIGEKLKHLGREQQVIVISHLPQVAAKAENHYLIEKKTENGRTISSLKKIKSEERKFEIARMIFGDKTNEITLKQAEEMLN